MRQKGSCLVQTVSFCSQRNVGKHKKAEMDLGQRDNRFLELKYQIECKQKSLLDRFNNVKQAAAENELLNGVLEDYVSYYRDALAAKRQQEESLTLLRDYLGAMSEAATVSDAQLEYLKEERDVTIEKLNSVKRDLQNLLQKTGIPE